MAEIKAHEFDQFLRRRAGDYHLYLVYGPDRGLVSERASALINESGVDSNDAFSCVRLEAATIASDPGRLFDEAYSTGLFGGKKLLWIKGAGADKSLADALSALTEKMPEDTWIVVEAGDIKKGANIRKAVESSNAGMAIPCYADDVRSLNAVIDQELETFSLKMTASARQILLDSLGGDRIASRGEIRKLALYAMGEVQIEDHHVTEIIGDSSAISIDDAVDAVLSGDRPGFLHATRKVIDSKSPIFLVLQGCIRQLQLLDLMRTDIEEKRATSADCMSRHARHLNFRRKPAVETALKSWNTASISRELNRLQLAVLQSRQRNSIEDTISMQTLLATTLMAGRLRAQSGRQQTLDSS